MRSDDILKIKEDQEEYKRCLESESYFYNKYVKHPNDPEVTEEQWQEIKNRMIVARNQMKFKYRNNEHYLTLGYDQLPDFLKSPLSEDEVFRKEPEQ